MTQQAELDYAFEQGYAKALMNLKHFLEEDMHVKSKDAGIDVWIEIYEHNNKELAKLKEKK